MNAATRFTCLFDCGSRGHSQSEARRIATKPDTTSRRTTVSSSRDGAESEPTGRLGCQAGHHNVVYSGASSKLLVLRPPTSLVFRSASTTPMRDKPSNPRRQHGLSPTTDEDTGEKAVVEASAEIRAARRLDPGPPSGTTAPTERVEVSFLLACFSLSLASRFSMRLSPVVFSLQNPSGPLPSPFICPVSRSAAFHFLPLA